MKFVSTRDGKIIIEEMDVPKLNTGDILIKMKACSICGSDLEKVYCGGYGKSMRLGHEISGEVVETKNEKFAVGDRVYVHHHVPCYDCYYCKREDYVLCEEYMKSNVDPCGLSEYIRVPKMIVDKGGVLKIQISYEEAALIEPLACCIKSVNKLNARKNDIGCVIGCGPVGMMHTMLLNCKKMFAVDISDFRLNFAKRYAKAINADNAITDIKKATDDIGVDFVIVATGNIKAIEQAIEIVRKGGKIMIFGVPPKGSIMNLDMNYIFFKEISILTSGYCSEVETNKALELIRSKKVDVKSLITHRFPLEKANEAFEIAHSGNAMKIVMTD